MYNVLYSLDGWVSDVLYLYPRVTRLFEILSVTSSVQFGMGGSTHSFLVFRSIRRDSSLVNNVWVPQFHNSLKDFLHWDFFLLFLGLGHVLGLRLGFSLRNSMLRM